jgi:hypothetical protein
MEIKRQLRKLDTLEPKETWVAYKGDLIPESKFRRRTKERKRELRERGERRERGDSGIMQDEITPPSMSFSNVLLFWGSILMFHSNTRVRDIWNADIEPREKF